MSVANDDHVSHPSRLQMLRAATASAASAALGASPARAIAQTPDDRLVDLLDLASDAKHLGGGLTFDLGAVFPLTGTGAIGIGRSTDVTKLAFDQIAALGGPRFRLVLKDNKSGDPQAGVQAVRELGYAHVPMMLSSYAADLSAMLQGIKQYKIFTLDGSGGAPVFAQARPYFWGSIAVSPDDAITGAITFIESLKPQVVKISSCGWDLGQLSDEVGAHILSLFRGTHFEAGVNERVAVGTTDFSASLAKIKASDPDIVLLFVYANDVGYFMKQYATSGIGKPVFAFAHSATAAQIAGAAYEGLYFAFDYFDAAAPPNEWARHFVRAYEAMSGGVAPDHYTANTYEDVFTIWECVRRVLRKGGDPHDGAQLDAALRERPEFPSLYGAGPKAGRIAFDPATHSVRHRPMIVGRYVGGAVRQLAHFDAGGAGFRFA